MRRLRLFVRCREIRLHVLIDVVIGGAENLLALTALPFYLLAVSTELLSDFVCTRLLRPVGLGLGRLRARNSERANDLLSVEEVERRMEVRA